MVKHFTAKGRAVPLWFWRTAGGAEVDLLIERGGRFTAIEAKFTETPERSDLKGLEALGNFYGPNSLVNGIIACRAARAYKMPEPLYSSGEAHQTAAGALTKASTWLQPER